MDISLDEIQAIDVCCERLFSEADHEIKMLSSILTNIETNGICRQTAATLESIDELLLPETCPVSSYTNTPSKTNLNVTTESLIGKIRDIVVDTLRRIYEFVLEKLRQFARFVSGKSRKEAKIVLSSAKENASEIIKGSKRFDLDKFNSLDKSYTMTYLETHRGKLQTAKVSQSTLNAMMKLVGNILDSIDHAMENLEVAYGADFDSKEFNKLHTKVYRGIKSNLESLWKSAPVMRIYQGVDDYFLNSDLAKRVEIPSLSPRDVEVLKTHEIPYSLTVVDRRVTIMKQMGTNFTKSTLTEKEAMEIPRFGLELDNHDDVLDALEESFTDTIDRVSKSKKRIDSFNIKSAVHSRQEVNNYRDMLLQASRFVGYLSQYQQKTLFIVEAMYREKKNLFQAYNDCVVDA